MCSVEFRKREGDYSFFFFEQYGKNTIYVIKDIRQFTCRGKILMATFSPLRFPFQTAPNRPLALISNSSTGLE